MFAPTADFRFAHHAKQFTIFTESLNSTDTRFRRQYIAIVATTNIHRVPAASESIDGFAVTLTEIRLTSSVNSSSGFSFRAVIRSSMRVT